MDEKVSMFEGEIEADKSTSVARVKKRGRGSAGKVLVFVLLQPNWKVYVEMIPDNLRQVLIPIICERTKLDCIVYTDASKSYDVLDFLQFKHYRINYNLRFS